MKKSFILSMTPLGWLTFGIWPLIMSIMLIVKRDQFEDPNFALITGIVSIFVGYFIIGIILGCMLKPKTA